eukprot:g1370.t1
MRRGKALPNDITCNMVISACAKGGHWQLAVDLLCQMPAVTPDLISCNSAINACEVASEWAAALACFKALEEKQLQPDIIVYGGVISACAKAGFWQLTLRIFEELCRRMSPDLVACNAALRAFKGNRWPVANAILQNFDDFGLQADVVTFSTAITSCVDAWPMTLQLLTEMHSAQIEANVWSFSSAMTCMSGAALSASLDLWYLLLQTLCTIPLLSTSVADTIIVSLATLLPRFLLGLCARHLWLALLGGAIHWAVSLHSIFSSLSSSDLLFAQTAELLIYYAGVVTIRQQMYENVKMMNTFDPAFKRPISLGCVEIFHQRVQATLTLQNDDLLKTIVGTLAISTGTTNARSKRTSPVSLLPVKMSRVCYVSALASCASSMAWEAALACLTAMQNAQMTPGAVEVGTLAESFNRALGHKAARELLCSVSTSWKAGKKDAVPNFTAEEIIMQGWSGHNFVCGCSSREYSKLGGPGLLMANKPESTSTEEFAAALAARLNCRLSSSMEKWLVAQLAARLVEKEYLCLCEGEALGPPGTTGLVVAPIRTMELDRADRWGRRRDDGIEVSPTGRIARTEYQVLRRFSCRVHFAFLGRPLLGDLTYGRRDSLSVCPRLFLHCRRFSCIGPDGTPLVAEAPLPPELQNVLETL